MRPSGVIFDLDGTLTEPQLDFDAIRAEIGLPDGPILEQLAGRAPDEQARADEVLRRHELGAIEQAVLADGAEELLARLRAREVPHAILTRNTREAVQRFLTRFGLPCAAVYTREDGPPKPAPAGVHRLCAAMRVKPAETLVVGDFKFDVLAGRSAGARTALVAPEPPEDLAAWGSPDLVVRSLRELLDLFP